ncbi:hypothetical protein ACIRST_41545 [Kitasatospora sp. NPDC101447]|uniref:hypothetical protein n=1 Tax=Kitasatospora sp. NPDC101447 TaxID=3364102 RepID=UPI00380D0CE1
MNTPQTRTEPTAATVTRHLVLGDISRQYQVLGGNTPTLVVELAPEPGGTLLATAHLRPEDTVATSVLVLDGDGGRPVQAPADPAAPVWAGLGPGPALTALGRDDLAALAPLMLLRTHGSGAERLTEVMMCSRVRSVGVLFVRVARFPHAAVTDPSDLVREALGYSSRLADSVVFEGSAFTVLEPEIEIEQKVNLLDEVSIWTLAQAMCEAAEQGRYPGFFLDPGYELTRWQYGQETFEVLAPREHAGYFGFTKMPDGRYLMKIKTFEQDALRRGEKFRLNLDIPGDDLDAFLAREYPELSFHRLPPLVRARFDVNLESAATGHLFSIEIDDVTVAGGHKLRQAEVEYLKTRVHEGIDHALLDTELERLTGFVEEHLKDLGVRAERSLLSKLTFLRECERRGAGADS